MARVAKISTTGLKELTQIWRKGQKAFDARDVSQLLAESLEPMKDQALSNLEGVVGSHELSTGGRHIEDALVLQASQDASRMNAVLFLPHKVAPQGLWLEFGHRIVGHKPKKVFKGQVTNPRPWFRPAVVAKTDAVRRNIRVGLQEICSKIFGFGEPGNADS